MGTRATWDPPKNISVVVCAAPRSALFGCNPCFDATSSDILCACYRSRPSPFSRCTCRPINIPFRAASQAAAQSCRSEVVSAVPWLGCGPSCWEDNNEIPLSGESVFKLANRFVSVRDEITGGTCYTSKLLGRARRSPATRGTLWSFPKQHGKPQLVQQGSCSRKSPSQRGSALIARNRAIFGGVVWKRRCGQSPDVCVLRCRIADGRKTVRLLLQNPVVRDSYTIQSVATCNVSRFSIWWIKDHPANVSKQSRNSINCPKEGSAAPCFGEEVDLGGYRKKRRLWSDGYEEKVKINTKTTKQQSTEESVHSNEGVRSCIGI